MILTQINGRWLLELTEEQVARAQALAVVQERWAINRAQVMHRPVAVQGIAGTLHSIIVPGLYELEAKWRTQLYEHAMTNGDLPAPHVDLLPVPA